MSLSSVLFALPPLALLALLVFRPGRPGRLGAALGVTAPYLVAALLLVAFGRDRLTHFEVEGFLFAAERSEGKSRAVSLGGGAGDEILLPGSATAPPVPAGLFRVRPDAEGARLEPGPGWDGRWTVEVSGRLAGLVPLPGDAEIALETAGGETVSFRVEKGGLFGRSVEVVAGEARRRLPTEGSRLPGLAKELPGFSLPSPRERVFPVVDLLPEPGDGAGEDTSAAAPRSVLLSLPADDSPWTLETNPLALLVLDRAAVVDGERHEPFPVRLTDGDSLAFGRITRERAPRLVRELAFEDFKRFSSSLGFDLARTPRVAVPDFGPGERITVSGRADLSSQDRLLRFEGLPERFADVVAVVAGEGSGFVVESAYGAERRDWGGAVALGGADRLVLRVSRGDPLGRPVALLLGTALALWLLAAPLLVEPRAAGDRARPWAVALFGAVAVLSTTRLLFGWAASQLPPFSGESRLLAFVALPMLPAVTLAAVALGRWSASGTTRRPGEGAGGGARLGARPALLAGVAGCLFAVLAVVPELAALPAGLAAGSLLPLAVAGGAAAVALFGRRWGGRWARLSGDVEAALEPPSYGSLAIAAAAIYGVRLLLLLAGAAESISVGPAQILLSVVYVPAFVVLLALGVARHLELLSPRARLDLGGAPATPAERVLQFAGYALGLVTLHVSTGFLVGDLGLAIYAIPAALFLAVLAFDTHRELPRADARWSPLLALPLAGVLFLLAMPVTVLRVGEVALDADLGVERLEDRDAVIREQKLLRFLQYLDPERLPELGTRSAETIAQHLALMDAYARRGLTGEGFLDVPVVPALANTALNDNVAAVYVLGQLGWIGALGLVAGYVLLLLPALGTRWGPAAGPLLAPEGSEALAAAVAPLAALTLAGASLYVLASNANLLPFTGRNLYLLGLNSLSDLWEGGILLALLAWALGRREGAA